MLTTFNLDEYVYHALKAGASGFLLKDASREQLADAVRAVAAGETLLAPAITLRLIEDFCRGPAPGTAAGGPAGRLSERELDVVRMVAQGLSNAEIAAGLYLSEATSKATSPARSPNSTCAIASRSPSTPTNTASSGPVTAPTLGPDDGWQLPTRFRARGSTVAAEIIDRA